eukprot:SAG22_NODE_9393_length_592_cov_0.778905_1_plen_168_part_01
MSLNLCLVLRRTIVRRKLGLSIKIPLKADDDDGNAAGRDTLQTMQTQIALLTQQMRELNVRIDRCETGTDARVLDLEQRLDASEAEVKQDVAELKIEVSQCVLGTASFVQYVEGVETKRRQTQEAQCHGTGMQTMLAVCCPSSAGGGSGEGGGHRRELQSHGCTAFPD